MTEIKNVMHTKEEMKYSNEIYSKVSDLNIEVVSITIKKTKIWLGTRKHILDLGCGSGKVTEKLCKYCEVIGCDFSRNLITKAKNRVILAKFILCDINSLCFSDNSFDLIISAGVLHHVSNINSVIKEIHRCLRKGGYFLAFEPNSLSVQSLVLGKYAPLRFLFKQSPYEAPISIFSLKKIIEKVGFDSCIIKTEYIFPYGLIVKLPKSLQKLISKFDVFLSKIFPFNYLGCSLHVISKK